MAIGHYIKEIGRGKDGARALTRAQATDLLGQVLDGTATDLELGGFCLAMRIKGETPEEMAGFLDAVEARLNKIPAAEQPTIVIPSYNGARKLPLLTPLLALLLAREGLPVLLHGTATEDQRIFVSKVLEALDIRAQEAIKSIANGSIHFVPTSLLCAGLQRLLDVRRVLQLRNPAHSLVKLMNPVAGPAVIVSSYTHPEYAVSMARTFELVGANALLIRGTEGESVADPRRTPRMQAFVQGQATELQASQSGALTQLPQLPTDIDALSTARYIKAVMDGKDAVPEPIALQVAHIVNLTKQVQNAPSRGATP